MKGILKPGVIALGLALMPLPTLCYGQTNEQGPSHNVIYWNGDTAQLQSLASSSATDVIVNFVTPNTSCKLYGLPNGIANSVQTLHNNGKTVLLSLGNASSSQYASCANNVNYLADQLVNYVTSNGFDGVDIDFEDTSAFSGEAAYDGVQFLTDLTDDLYSDLPQWHNIITHAPQTPYWLNNYHYAYPPYAQIYWNTNWQTNEIAWFNDQTYGNCLSAGGEGNGGTDCTASDKITSYDEIVNWWGVNPVQLVVGFPVSPCATGTDPNTGQCTGDGYLTPYDGSNNDVYTVIYALQGAYPDRFGGVMGWNYADNPDWVGAVWGALWPSQPVWVGQDAQTGLCLDSDIYGNAYTDNCNTGNYQNWRFDVNGIVNAQTGLCLDSNSYGQVYTKSCRSGGYTSWQFFGKTIRARDTGRCLDSNYAGQIYTQPCNTGNYQNWIPNDGHY